MVYALMKRTLPSSFIDYNVYMYLKFTQVECMAFSVYIQFSCSLVTQWNLIPIISIEKRWNNF